MTTPSAAVRYPAPDIARGAMLILIALANVPFWSGYVTSGPPSTADQVWLFIRTIFVDGHAYPMFALLLGFGVTIISERAQARGENVITVRRLLRRRGWWLLLFGFVHAVLFPGDILGTYGVVILLCAGLIVMRRTKTLVIIGVVIALISVGMASGPSTMHDLPPELAASGVPAPSMAEFASTLLPNIVNGLISWAIVIPIGLPTTAIIPAFVVGYLIARRGILAEPQRYRTQLLWGAIFGLGLGAALGIAQGLHVGHFVSGEAHALVGPLNALGGMLGALGWISLFGYLASRVSTQPSWVTRLVIATGARSMTAYLLQTLFFAVIFAILRRAGSAVNISIVATALIAVAVWIVIALICRELDRRGMRGPFERLHRHLVAISARKRSTELAPADPAAQPELAAIATAAGENAATSEASRLRAADDAPMQR